MPSKTSNNRRGERTIEDDYLDLYQTWNQEKRTPEATAKAVRRLTPAIKKLTQQHTGRSDLATIAKARRLAIDALKTYDPDKGKMSNHLYSSLMGLKRQNAQSRNPIQVSERLLAERRTLAAAESELLDEMGLPPSTQQLADKTGFKPDRITKIQSYNTPVPSAGRDIQTQHQRGVPAFWRDAIYEGLPASDQLVMEHTYGMHGKPVYSTQRIAGMINRNPSAVSKRKKIIETKLNEGLDVADLIPDHGIENNA